MNRIGNASRDLQLIEAMRVIAPPTLAHQVSMVKIVKVMAVAERLVCGAKSVLSDDFVKNSSQESEPAVKAAKDMLRRME